MAFFSRNDDSRARRIVEQMVETGSRDVHVDDDLPISDVEADAADFVSDLNILDRIGADVPAVRVQDRELVPLALSALAGSQSPILFGPDLPRLPPVLDEWRYFYFQALLSGTEPRGFATISHGQARSTFLNRAADFLATRIAALREFRDGAAFGWSQLNVPQRVNGRRIATPGCNFTVSTNSTGLRVFWSGAYRISPNYFSHPTTPTGSVLQSGTYLFGVDGGAYGSQIQWDFNAPVTLPGSPHAHLNF